MDRGRILLLGQSKEHTYEVRNLLDNKRFEIEIALSVEVAKTVLTQRGMNLLVMHTEVSQENAREFFDFCEERGVTIPLFVFGEETTQFRDLTPDWVHVSYFEKPYAADEVFREIDALKTTESRATIGLNPNIT